MKNPTPTAEILQIRSGDMDARQLPNFTDQVADDTRQELITSAAEATYGLGSDTSISDNVLETRTFTEQEALAQTLLLLQEAMTNPKLSAELVLLARDIYENLSFIGKKELMEATQSIARYWKAYLNDNPNSSIFIVTSKTFESSIELGDDETQEDEFGYISDNKSDDYIVDHILSNFSHEEMQRYGGRILLAASDLAGQELRLVKTIVVDDWIMSGQQIRNTLDRVFEYMTPTDLEVNLVVCNEDRLTNGITHDRATTPIPVKAHFVSHDADHPYALEFGGAYLTAAHSSGDYPFEGSVEKVVDSLNRIRVDEEAIYMPPLANVIRPYYSPDYRSRHVERLRLLRSIGHSALL